MLSGVSARFLYFRSLSGTFSFFLFIRRPSALFSRFYIYICLDCDIIGGVRICFVLLGNPSFMIGTFSLYITMFLEFLVHVPCMWVENKGLRRAGWIGSTLG